MLTTCATNAHIHVRPSLYAEVAIDDFEDRFNGNPTDYEAQCIDRWAGRLNSGLERVLVHADGSRTFIYYEDDTSFCDPRDDDGNVVTMVNLSTDYLEMDEPDSRIAEAYEHWHDDGYLRYFLRWLRIYRPDVAHFDEWQVSGPSQSDWKKGYGYITWDQLFDNGFTLEHLVMNDLTPKYLFECEIRLYQTWFEGEVYFAVHIDTDGHQDSCGGYLGYDSPADVATDFTSSTIVREEHP